MDYKLRAKKITVEQLRTKYLIKSKLFNTVIKLDNVVKDVNEIQKLINKEVVVDIEDNIITIID